VGGTIYAALRRIPTFPRQVFTHLPISTRVSITEEGSCIPTRIAARTRRAAQVAAWRHGPSPAGRWIHHCDDPWQVHPVLSPDSSEAHWLQSTPTWPACCQRDGIGIRCRPQHGPMALRAGGLLRRRAASPRRSAPTPTRRRTRRHTRLRSPRPGPGYPVGCLSASTSRWSASTLASRRPMWSRTCFIELTLVALPSRSAS
jgi:hypothetical protein